MGGLARKTLHGFEPVGEEGQKIHQGMAYGDTCRIEHIKGRNYDNHSRYFAFIHTVFDMQDHFHDDEIMRKWVQMKAGYYDEFITPKGKIVYIAKSIAFDKLDELEFRKLFTKSITAVINSRLQDGSPFISDMTENELMRILDYD